MSRLDDFFKGKLRQRELEMKDVYWADMEKLLDRKERKRRVFFWWIWGFGLGAVLLAGLLAWCLVPVNGDSTREIVKGGKVEIFAEEVEVDASGMHGANEEKQLMDIKSKTRKVEDAENTGTNLIANKSQTNKTPELPVFINEESISVTTQLPDLTDKLMEGVDNELDNNDWVSQTEALIENKAFELFDPVPTVEAGLLAMKGGSDTSILVALQVELMPKRRWSFYLEGATTAYPYLEGGKTAIGGTLGGTASYQWNHQWAVALGLGYRYRTGSFDFAKSSTVSSYRFGREDIHYFLLPDELHFVEMPLSIQWTTGRHQIEAGGRLSYLLGVRGQLASSFVSESSASNATTTEESGWLKEDGFTKWHMDLTLGYGYRMNTSFAVWARGAYTVPGILNDGYIAPFGLQLTESKPLFVDVGLRFYFK